MNKIQHPSNNRVLGAPPGMSHDQCSALAVTKIAYTNQDDPLSTPIPAIRSYWTPTAEELKFLNEGGYVCLEVLGETMPPVIVTAEEKK